ncbi:MAG: GNAT family N-acetyltransferase [Hyphomicrobiales bacterium]|nr:GNAT family N-acetyltransferase [Hyphomicrobiales bacterium]
MPEPHSSAGGREPIVLRLSDLDDQPDRAAIAAAEINAIFFEASGRTFVDAASKDAFHDLWLGQYLRHDRGHVWLAVQPIEGGTAGRVVGYLAGSRANPAQDPRFAELPYFAELAEPCRRYPAHLHINLAQAERGRGIGGRLIAAFSATLREAGEPGVHVVTGALARNVSFYRRLGFDEVARCTWNGRPLAMLVRAFR